MTKEHYHLGDFPTVFYVPKIVQLTLSKRLFARLLPLEPAT